MIEECQRWVNEARDIFPNLDKYTILGEYSRMSKKSLGYVKSKIFREKDIDPEALLLEGKSISKKKRKETKEFKILINKNILKIRNIQLRKQVVQHIVVHELLHIEKRDLLTLDKEYNRRKKKRIHTKDFEQEAFERFNKLREINNIAKIKNKDDLNLAINKIISSIKFD